MICYSSYFKIIKDLGFNIMAKNKNGESIESYLKEFAAIADDWFQKQDWFQYSVDYRIGTRYMDEHIVDNFKREAMGNPFLAELLRSPRDGTQTRLLMWLGFLDTAQCDFVEAQATSGKAPPPVGAFSGRDEPVRNRDR